MIGEKIVHTQGVYPNVIDFGVNFRNKRETTAQDVTSLSMGLSKMTPNSPLRSMTAIMTEPLSGSVWEKPWLPSTTWPSVRIPGRLLSIKFTITFRLSSEGDLHTEEGVFYVHVVSKDGGRPGEFDANDRVRARVIVEGYHTVPEEVYAGNG